MSVTRWFSSVSPAHNRRPLQSGRTGSSVLSGPQPSAGNHYGRRIRRSFSHDPDGVPISGDTNPAHGQLSSSNTAKATVPATATIPAGATSVTINVSAVNNNLFDNDATVTLTASATGFTNATANLSVTNDDVRTLTATVNNSTISESAGTTAATITVARNTADTTAALTVNLTTTSNNNRITIPTTLTIPAGSASAHSMSLRLPILLDDGARDAAQWRRCLRRGIRQWLHKRFCESHVTDDDAPALQLQVASSTVAENLAAGTVTYTLTRNSADISQPLTVNLNAGSQSRLTVPATVTIPANGTTVQFTGTINNNGLDDNNINVLTTASASASPMSRDCHNPR